MVNVKSMSARQLRNYYRRGLLSGDFRYDVLDGFGSLIDVKSGEVFHVRETPFSGEDGLEYLDVTPLSIPLGWSAPLPLNDRIERMIRRPDDGYTFDGLDDTDEDLDVDLDDDPVSPYELRTQDAYKEISRVKEETKSRSRRSAKAGVETPPEGPKIPQGGVSNSSDSDD